MASYALIEFMTTQISEYLDACTKQLLQLETDEQWSELTQCCANLTSQLSSTLPKTSNIHGSWPLTSEHLPFIIQISRWFKDDTHTFKDVYYDSNALYYAKQGKCRRIRGNFTSNLSIEDEDEHWYEIVSYSCVRIDIVTVGTLRLYMDIVCIGSHHVYVLLNMRQSTPSSHGDCTFFMSSSLYTQHHSKFSAALNFTNMPMFDAIKTSMSFCQTLPIYMSMSQLCPIPLKHLSLDTSDDTSLTTTIKLYQGNSNRKTLTWVTKTYLRHLQQLQAVCDIPPFNIKSSPRLRILQTNTSFGSIEFDSVKRQRLIRTCTFLPRGIYLPEFVWVMPNTFTLEEVYAWCTMMNGGKTTRSVASVIANWIGQDLTPFDDAWIDNENDTRVCLHDQDDICMSLTVPHDIILKRFKYFNTLACFGQHATIPTMRCFTTQKRVVKLPWQSAALTRSLWRMVNSNHHGVTVAHIQQITDVLQSIEHTHLLHIPIRPPDVDMHIHTLLSATRTDVHASPLELTVVMTRDFAAFIAVMDALNKMINRDYPMSIHSYPMGWHEYIRIHLGIFDGHDRRTMDVNHLAYHTRIPNVEFDKYQCKFIFKPPLRSMFIPWCYLTCMKSLLAVDQGTSVNTETLCRANLASLMGFHVSGRKHKRSLGNQGVTPHQIVRMVNQLFISFAPFISTNNAYNIAVSMLSRLGRVVTSWILTAVQHWYDNIPSHIISHKKLLGVKWSYHNVMVMHVVQEVDRLLSIDVDQYPVYPNLWYLQYQKTDGF